VKWEGGEVLGIGRFVVGYAVPVGPMPVLSKDLLERLPKRNSPQEGPQACVVVPTECGGGLLDALRQMDPCDWNGEHDDWRDLMGACKAVGIDREDFVAWSIGDPVYRNEAAHIRHEWGTLWAEHGGAFYKALSQRGIKVQQHNKVQHQHMPKGSHLRPTVSVRKRTDRTCAILAAAVGFMRKRSCGIRLA
jgi:hypothetical protein